MNLYLDTSVLVAMYAKEANAEKIAGTLEQSGAQIFISDWSVTEFWSAIAFKLVNAQASETVCFEALRKFDRDQEGSLVVLPVASIDFRRAATFAFPPSLRVRAGDALHLSMAYGNKLLIATLDKRMEAAAKALGIDVVEITSP